MTSNNKNVSRQKSLSTQYTWRWPTTALASILLMNSLSADFLWGSFVTHAWQTNPKGRLRGGYLWAGFNVGSSDSMGPGKTQYTTKYARNAVFDKVLIKNDFPCISQFVFLLFELLLQPFWSLSDEFFCAGCYKQGLKLHKKTSGETKNRNCSMNSSSPHPDTNFRSIL